MADYGLFLFDWNGTIQDDLECLYTWGVQRIFRQFGLPCPTMDQYRNEVTGNFLVFYQSYGIPADVTAEALNAIVGEGYKERGSPPDVFPDALAAVAALHGRGHPLALASGYDAKKLTAAVANRGFAPYFASVVGDVRDKPAVCKELVAKHGVPDRPKVGFVGDTIEDALAAAAVGATPFICPRGFHTRERIETVRDRAPGLVIIDSLGDIFDHL
jgi:phosphoglycolate phosphatase-like HAD superfamily hydrolase